MKNKKHIIINIKSKNNNSSNVVVFFDNLKISKYIKYENKLIKNIKII